MILCIISGSLICAGVLLMTNAVSIAKQDSMPLFNAS